MSVCMYIDFCSQYIITKYFQFGSDYYICIKTLLFKTWPVVFAYRGIHYPFVIQLPNFYVTSVPQWRMIYMNY